MTLFEKGVAWQERRQKQLLSLNPTYKMAQSTADLYDRIEMFGCTERSYRFLREKRKEYLDALLDIQDAESKAFRKANREWLESADGKAWLSGEMRADNGRDTLPKERDYQNGHVTIFADNGEVLAEKQ